MGKRQGLTPRLLLMKMVCQDGEGACGGAGASLAISRLRSAPAMKTFAGRVPGLGAGLPDAQIASSLRSREAANHRV